MYICIYVYMHIYVQAQTDVKTLHSRPTNIHTDVRTLHSRPTTMVWF